MLLASAETLADPYREKIPIAKVMHFKRNLLPAKSSSKILQKSGKPTNNWITQTLT
jgi:hypothetical protein